MKLGLKLWSTNRNYFEEAQRFVSERVCDYIELYVVPGTIEEFVMLWKSINIPYIVHAPHAAHNMNLAKADHAESNRRLAEEAFAFADLLEAKHLIFHPGLDGNDEETIRQLQSWPKEWRERILIENKPYRSVDEPPRICNGHSPAAIQRIMEETDIGFCFDIGHGICSSNSRKVDPWTDIAAFEQLGPSMYHLSDNDFQSEIDGHRNLGGGNYNFKRIFEIIDSSKPISLETKKQFSDSLRDFVEDLLFVRNRLYEFSFQKAAIDDMKDVFELANDPVVRSCSIQCKPISWETHCDWFTKKMEQMDSRFWIVRDATGKLTGYVRYELDRLSGCWICSIAFSPETRGKGIGTFVLKKTFEWHRNESPDMVEAWIQKTNTPSIRAFEKSGYQKADERSRDGIDYFIFQR